VGANPLKMKKLLPLLSIIFLVVLQTKAIARVTDSPAVLSGGIQDRSHENKISAVQVIPFGEEVLWTTSLPYRFEPKRYARVEHDIQWCMLTIVAVAHEKVEATNCLKDKFYLDIKTGKLLSVTYSKSRKRKVANTFVDYDTWTK
jgi:hypothetical protein